MIAEILRLLQASSCFRGEVCASLPCACAETLAALSRPAQRAPNAALADELSRYVVEGRDYILDDLLKRAEAALRLPAQRAPDHDKIALDAARSILGVGRSLPLVQWKARIQCIVLDALSAVTSTERCDGADDLEHLDGMLDDRERGET